MERNSIIVERLEKSMGDSLPRTSKYDKQTDEVIKLEQELFELIGNDKQIVAKCLEIESACSKKQLEYESMCFCEGVRLGFKLCMDIFEI